jgi:predicted ATP-grasp superfamily ATP-dependent carboligase
MNSKPQVFVTDGSYQNSLAAVRSLSQSGFRVTVGERTATPLLHTVSFWSRHCAARVRYPDPRREPEGCAAALAAHFRQRSYAAVIPVGLDMVEVCIRHKDVLRAPMMLPPLESFLISLDKRLTFAHARALGVPVPQTLPATRWREAECPMVFKHSRTGALIAKTFDAASFHANRLGADLPCYLVQQYIPGQNGFGYFGFFQNGLERGYFMHERLVQFPKEGGPSVLARAVHIPRLRELGRTLLESLSWHGVAMVEFKRSDKDGEFYLMEINPKLWGSLDLAIQSGCDFPVWVARALATGSMPSLHDYCEGLTYQWVIPNGVKCFLRYPEFRILFLRNLARGGIRSDLRIMDPLPAAAGLLAMATNLRSQ